jgi:hypothetical protein
MTQVLPIARIVETTCHFKTKLPMLGYKKKLDHKNLKMKIR